VTTPASVPVDLQADGVLWMINKAVFHPRGFALAIDQHGLLSLMGDGSEPWTYEHDLEDAKFAAFNALLARAVQEPPHCTITTPHEHSSFDDPIICDQ
jgi:hypothetical protein